MNGWWFLPPLSASYVHRTEPVATGQGDHALSERLAAGMLSHIYSVPHKAVNAASQLALQQGMERSEDYVHADET